MTTTEDSSMSKVKEYLQANLTDGDAIQVGQSVAMTEVYEVVLEILTSLFTELEGMAEGCMFKHSPYRQDCSDCTRAEQIPLSKLQDLKKKYGVE